MTEYRSPSNEKFIERVANQTYQDILDSPVLRSAVVQFEGVTEPFDLRRLPSVPANQAHAIKLGKPQNAAQLVLQVAEANQQLVIANDLGLVDIYTHDGVQDVLGEKLRAAVRSPAAEGFIHVLDLVGLPDIGLAVERGDLPFREALDLRSSRDAEAFRNWLGSLNPEEPREVERAVARDLFEPYRGSGLGVRSLRLAVTVGLGLLNPAAGLAASAADSFLIDRLIRGWRPRLFLDRISKILDD